MEITEWRGVKGLVCAEVTKDDSTGYTAGVPFEIAGVAELSRTTENSSETKYYDNVPAIVIDSVGSDTVTIKVSAIDLDVLAKITGQYYDETTGMFVEGERESKYFAIGYLTEKTNGDKMYVWRLKGKFSIPDSQHMTKTNGTESNGQEITFTGINTTAVFEKTGKTAKAVNVDGGLALTDVSTFFETVQTPDTVVASA